MTTNKPVRVGTRISADTNNWLDQKAFEMGLTKAALINIAIENYRKEYESIRTLPDMVKQLKTLAEKNVGG